jgi:outer membrane protein assembly factor BamB
MPRKFVPESRRRPPAAFLLLLVTLCLIAAPVMAASGTDERRSLSREDVLREVQQMAGVCLCLGCEDGAFAAGLAESGNLLVQVLEADETKVKRARNGLLQRGLYGLVSVDGWSSPRLPQADNLVNVIVVEQATLAPTAELLRVLTPRGVAFIRDGATWRTLSKPWPEAYDEWTHPRHDAGGNMVSADTAVAAPTGLRWVAGPPQDTGGRRWYNDHALVSAHGRNFYLQEDAVTARDAFNGSLLWTRPIKPAVYRERGAQLPLFLQTKVKQGFRTSRVKPVATKECLYLATEGALLSWAAHDGKTMTDYGPVGGARLLLVVSNRLVVSCTNLVFACDLALPGRLWSQPLETEQIVASGGLVLCVTRDSVLALDLATGQPRWRSDRALSEATATATCHDGVLVVEESSWRDDGAGCRLLAYSATDGRLLWQREHRPGMTHFQESRALFAQNLILLQWEAGKIIGIDPQTGRQQRAWTSRGLHCASPVATERYFLAPECEFTDLETGARSRARMFKSACRLPFIPANGLLYSFPVQCECYPMLRGYMGLSSVPTPQLATHPRLERGPAYGQIPPRAPAGPRADEWPTYRHDAFRSAASPIDLSAVPALGRAWSVTVTRPRAGLLAADWKGDPFASGLLTAPVAAEGLVYVAVPDEHRLVALEARSGQPRWTFLADGRIDTPPTIEAGFCLFGSHDGCVYCLQAETGQLLWQFRVAPSEARLMAYGQFESPWPLPGSVLVDKETAFVAAGRHPCSEDGVHVTALRVRTGEVLWEKVLTDVGLKQWYSPMLPNGQKVGLDFEPVDLLVKDGEAIALSRWVFNPANGSFKLHKDRTEYDAAGLPVPRGLWGYGIRQNKSVMPKPPACFDRAHIYLATTNDVALILTGSEIIRGTAAGLVERGRHRLQLDSPPVRDGLISAYRHIYAATREGKLVCLAPVRPGQPERSR